MTSIPIPDSGGVWTMTDAEFKRELASAWDEGSIAGWVESGLPHSWNSESSLRKANPYRSQA